MMDDISRAELLQNLTSTDPRQRCQAAIMLGRQGDPACIDVLVEALLAEDWNSCPLLEAQEILGQFRDERVVDTLIEIVFRPPCHFSLRAMGPLLNTGHPRGIDAIIELMGRDFVTNDFAARCIATLGSSIVDRLISVLKDENPMRRAMAAKALGIIADPAAVDALIETLAGEGYYYLEEFPVRYFVVKALEQIGDKRAIEPLVAYLHGDTWFSRIEAAKSLLSLGYTPRTEPLDVLIAGLESENASIRLAALCPVTSPIADPYAIPVLVQAMKTDESPAVRRYAAQTLGAIGDERVVPDLLACVDDPAFPVQREVKAALSQFGHELP